MSERVVIRPRKASDYIGRFHRVRQWNPASDALSPPYVLDRKHATLMPYKSDEWAVLPSGIAVPAMRGGAFSSLTPPVTVYPGLVLTGATAAQTLALDSSYTFGSAGDVVGWRVMLATQKTLAAMYFYISATSGTAANINDINFELRDMAAGGTLPGSTLHTSSSMNPNSDASVTGWHKQDPANFTMAARTFYWVLIADADGNSTDFATARTHLNTYSTFSGLGLSTVYTSAAGFSAAVNGTAAQPIVVLEFDDGTVCGSSAQASANVTNNSNRRGWRIGGFTETIKIFGIMTGAGGDADISGVELYADDGTAPGGTTLASGSSVLREIVSTGLPLGATFDPYTLAKATAYRLVLTYGGNAQIPQSMGLGTVNGHTTVLRKARPGGADWYYAIANGTTNWSNDDQDAQPQAVILIEDQVAVIVTSTAPLLAGLVVA